MSSNRPSLSLLASLSRCLSFSGPLPRRSRPPDRRPKIILKELSVLHTKTSATTCGVVQRSRYEGPYLLPKDISWTKRKQRSPETQNLHGGPCNAYSGTHIAVTIGGHPTKYEDHNTTRSVVVGRYSIVSILSKDLCFFSYNCRSTGNINIYFPCSNTRKSASTESNY